VIRHNFRLSVKALPVDGGRAARGYVVGNRCSSDKEKDYIWYDALFDLQERSGRLSEFVVLL
jgi:hypothetical protein